MIRLVWKYVSPLSPSHGHTVISFKSWLLRRDGGLHLDKLVFFAKAHPVTIMGTGTRHTMLHWQGCYVHWRSKGLHPCTRTFLHGVVCVYFFLITYYFGISEWRQHAFYSIMCEVQSISCYLGLLLWPLFFFQQSDGNAALIMYAFIGMIKWNNLLVFTGLLWILSRQIRKAHLNIDALNLW